MMQIFTCPLYPGLPILPQQPLPLEKIKLTVFGTPRCVTMGKLPVLLGLCLNFDSLIIRTDAPPCHSMMFVFKLILNEINLSGIISLQWYVIHIVDICILLLIDRTWLQVIHKRRHLQGKIIHSVSVYFMFTFLTSDDREL